MRWAWPSRICTGTLRFWPVWARFGPLNLGRFGSLSSLGLCLLGSLGAGSLVWAMCAVFVARDPTQVVAAVGSLAISGIAGVALFVVRVSRGTGARVTGSPDSAPAGLTGLTGLTGATVVTVVVAARGAVPLSSVAIEGSFFHAHLAVGLTGPVGPAGASPPKLAVFVFRADGADGASDLEPRVNE
jgi:hypothetical protein